MVVTHAHVSPADGPMHDVIRIGGANDSPCMPTLGMEGMAERGGGGMRNKRHTYGHSHQLGE